MTTSHDRYPSERSPAARADRSWHLIVLSARSAAALEAATTNLADHLQRNPDLDIADVAFTLETGRRLFEHRRFVVCRSLPEAAEALASAGDARVHTLAPAAGKPRVAFVFPGESPAVGAALELYEAEPAFARALAQISDEAKPFLGLDVQRLLYPGAPPGGAARALRDAGAAAAALLAIEYALATLWESWGVSPAAVMGHGAGEYASACVAGLIEPRDAAALAVARGRVLAGELDQAAFAKLARSIRLQPARLPCVSSVTGTWMPDTQADDAGYWLRQLQWTSAIDAGIGTLRHDGIGVLIHAGPGPLPLHEQGGEDGPLCLRSMSADQSKDSDLRTLVETLGRLYAGGVAVDWTAFHARRRPRRTPLPSYPFQPHRHWFAPAGPAGPSSLDAGGNPAGDADAAGAAPGVVLPGRPDFGEACVPPRDEVEETLVSLCEALLRIDGIGMHDNIVDLGVDSMFTMQLSREVGEVFGVAISPHHLFAEPNLASLAGKIRQLGPRLRAGSQTRSSAPCAPRRPVVEQNARVAEHNARVAGEYERAAGEYERLLSFVEGLSEAEVDQALRRLPGSNPPGSDCPAPDSPPPESAGSDSPG